MRIGGRPEGFGGERSDWYVEVRRAVLRLGMVRSLSFLHFLFLGQSLQQYFFPVLIRPPRPTSLLPSSPLTLSAGLCPRLSMRMPCNKRRNILLARKPPLPTTAPPVPLHSCLYSRIPSPAQSLPVQQYQLAVLSQPSILLRPRCPAAAGR